MKRFYGVELGRDAEAPAGRDEMLALFQHLRPEASPKPLIRIGEDADGAYLIPDDLEGIAACFSPGVNNFKTFEDAMVDRYGMNCHMCDFTSDVEKLRTPMIEGKQTFIKKWLDVAGDDSVRLDDWIAGQEPQGDLLLQIDIEGAEYRNLLDLPEAVLARFRIIVIELHGLQHMVRAQVLRRVLKPFFEKLSKTFAVVHAHPNNCCGSFTVPQTDVEIPNVLELTYLRRDRIDEGRHPPVIPHPLDVGRNVKLHAPLFLGEAWFDGERPAEARTRMLEVELAYARHALEAERSAMADRTAMLMRAAQVAAPEHIAPGSETEVAAGRPYRLSSAFKGPVKSGVIEARSPFLFQTRTTLGQWIRIDLGVTRAITRIVLTNRRNHPDRAHSLFAIVTDDKEGGEGRVFPIPDDPAFLEGARDTVEVAASGARGRYVIIRASAWTSLSLSNVAVFAAT
jgi:hypothetical protein